VYLNYKNSSKDRVATAVSKSIQLGKINEKALTVASAFQKLLMPSTLAAVASATTIAPTASVASAAASISASTTATAGRARFSRPCLVYSQRPAFNGLAIEFRDGVLSVLLRTHRHEREPARFAREFILHERHFLDGTRL
jgi:hypothetical protein